ncbi:hypothetical protein M378DRAFT_15140 [Amanita muscaria Koide BX008]|uniref:Uncharacterized protein n=1 Tax=Amanita muscaria (strain Koide BX008) TaxID=946122 RepID=A0A0C2SY50_AMAMK|nr:hypothetical protein M378DRAFT_15140 [Amanita muscaria Koide BX008]
MHYSETRRIPREQCSPGILLVSESFVSLYHLAMCHQLPRPSAFYNQHFSSNLVLERIGRLPSLVQDLASNVDTALQAALNTLPPLNDFITAQQRARDVRNFDTNVTDEKEVANIYNQTNA